MTDNTPLWSYALGVIGFTAVFLAVPVGAWWVNRKVDQRVNLEVHRALYPNVHPIHPERREAS